MTTAASHASTQAQWLADLTPPNEAVVRALIDTGLRTDDDLDVLEHYLDAADAGLPVSAELHALAHMHAQQYVRRRYGTNVLWDWRRADGAVQDIVQDFLVEQEVVMNRMLLN